MAVSTTPYLPGLRLIALAGVNLDTDTLKLMLLTSSYTPNTATHPYVSDVVAAEVSSSGTGYTTGGNTLNNTTPSNDPVNGLVRIDADSVVFSAVTLTARYAVVYKSTGSNATAPLLALIDFGENKSYSNENFQLTFSAGLFRLLATTTTV